MGLSSVALSARSLDLGKLAERTLWNLSKAESAGPVLNEY